MEMAPEQCQRMVYGVITIKQETVETDPLAFLKQEVKDVFVKEETVVESDPMASLKQEIKDEINEISVKEENPFLNEWDVPDGVISALDPLRVREEEFSSSDDNPRPNTFNIEKTEDEEDKEVTESINYDEELKNEVESRSSCSEPESAVLFAVEDDTDIDEDTSVTTKVHVTAQTGDRIKPTTNKKPSHGNKRFIRHMAHGNAQLHITENHIHVDSCKSLHSCSICHKTYMASSSLKRHFHLHNSERPFSCGVCNKTFSSGSCLKRHSLLHTGERPYSCGVCNKTFRCSSALKPHSLLHTGKRPFSCGICSKTFTQIGGLKQHLLVHTGERPFSCGVCNKTFKQRSHMKKHSLLHTG